MREEKKPDIPKGESWKDPKFKLTTAQAYERLNAGLNVGIVACEGLVIFDLDDPERYTFPKETLTVKTRNGKLHKFFLNDGTVKNAVGKGQYALCGEVRAEWQYVVAPGSFVPPDSPIGDGVYRVIVEHESVTLSESELPAEFQPTPKVTEQKTPTNMTGSFRNQYGWPIEDLRAHDPKLDGLLANADVGYASASEADMATLAKLLYWGYDEGKAIDILLHFRSREKLNRDDYLAATLSKIDRHETIANHVNVETWKPKRDTPRQEEQENDKKSQADKIVTLCLQQNPMLFFDQTGTPYARINQNGVNVTLPIRNRLFKAWLSSLLWTAEKKAPGNEAVSSALNVLVSKAMFEGERFTLYNRVAPADDGVWIDMTDERWRAIKVTAEGWRVVNDPPLLFKRYSHQQPLVEPKPGGDAWKLLDFFNIDPVDADTRLTVLCACTSFLIPLMPHPILTLYGIQGSGKSWIFRLLRRLLDPSSTEMLTLPKDERERVQQLDHNWLAFYDNITSMPSWMSDTLCRAATGGGFSKRELYSDDDDVIYNFKRCVGLNGINIAAQRGDLLDRSLLVYLQNIPREKRRTEERLLKEFEASKPEILGGFLDTLAKAMQVFPQVNPKELFRMADFTRWGCAIAIALGKTETEFLEAYEAKVKTQIEEAAHASPVATVLLDFFSIAKEPWEGTPTQLYIRLNEHAKMLGISTRQKAWPKAPNVLVRQLNELAPSLKSLGLDIETGIREGHDATRRIRVSTVSAVSTHEKNGKTADDNADDSKNEPSAEPSALKHGQSTLAVDADGKFPTSTRALAKWEADAPQQREQKKTTGPPDKTGDKVLTDVDPKPVQQNEPNPLVSFEMTSKTQAECVFDLADAAKLEPKKGITRKANSEECIEKREDNRVFAKSGEVMFQCQFCNAQDKPLFFSTEHDLELHVKAFHDPDKLPRKFQEAGMAVA